MLYAYASAAGGLTPLAPDADLSGATWIDLYRPLDPQVAAVTALGYDIPTLEDMEEIEISNRLYTDHGTVYMTGVLPGTLPDGQSAAMPVTFILNDQRLVTVRHHAPRPFETFPHRAGHSSSGCSSPERIFLGLVEEIVGRLADISEGVSKVLDQAAGQVLSKNAPSQGDFLRSALATIGQQAELMGRVRMGLLSMDRILVYHAGNTPPPVDSHGAIVSSAAIQRDIHALEVHADFLTSRIGMTIDATMGMIGLQQNERVRILAVITALFMPPTLITSFYGMNFKVFPSLDWQLGLPAALIMMAISVGLVLALLKYMNWL